MQILEKHHFTPIIVIMMLHHNNGKEIFETLLATKTVHIIER